MRHKIAEHIASLANAVEHHIAIPIEPAATFVEPALLADTRYGDYARVTVARYEELQNLTAILNLHGSDPALVHESSMPAKS
jgi:hypothetical protein